VLVCDYDFLFILLQRKSKAHIYSLCIYIQVKHIQKGINPSSVHEIYWTGEFVLKGLKIGVVAGMIGLTVSKYQPQYLNLEWEINYLVLPYIYYKPNKNFRKVWRLEEHLLPWMTTSWTETKKWWHLEVWTLLVPWHLATLRQVCVGKKLNVIKF
jgi:hypothetical protein